MGVSGFILKKRGNVDFYQLIHDVKQSAESGGYLPIIRSKVYESKYEGGVYVTGNIADTYDDVPDSQQWFMYIFSAGRDEFDWLVKGEDLFTAILIEKISDCSKMLLDFFI